MHVGHQHGHVGVGLGVVPQLRGPRVRIVGLLEPFEPREHDAPLVVPVGIAGVEPHRLVEAAQRLVCLLQRRERLAQSHAGLVRFRHGPDGVPQRLQRFGEPAHVGQRGALCDAGQVVARNQAQRLVGRLYRVGAPAALPVALGQVGVRKRLHAGRRAPLGAAAVFDGVPVPQFFYAARRGRLAVALFCLFGHAQHAVRVAHVVVDDRVVGAQPQCLLERGQGPLAVARHAERHAQARVPLRKVRLGLGHGPKVRQPGRDVALLHQDAHPFLDPLLSGFGRAEPAARDRAAAQRLAARPLEAVAHRVHGRVARVEADGLYREPQRLGAPSVARIARVRAHERGGHARVRREQRLVLGGRLVRLVGAGVVAGLRERQAFFEVAVQIPEIPAGRVLEALQGPLQIPVVQEGVAEAHLGRAGAGRGVERRGQVGHGLLAPAQVQQGHVPYYSRLQKRHVQPQGLVGALQRPFVVAFNGVYVSHVEVYHRVVGPLGQRGPVAPHGPLVRAERLARVAQVEDRVGPLVAQL